MPLLSNDAFLSQLNKLYEKSRQQRTVYVTMKRYAYPQRKDSKALADPDTEFPCIVRATSGSTKISTLVNPHETERFHQHYTNIAVLHMDSLKKKVKVKKPKVSKAATKDATKAAVASKA
ncbi:RNA-binding signal recognition particle subunit srp14 [Geranomyces variabilis]|nr:RNA-binding signal recognition particle subunit srp14 [Geranomyces variabilis]